MQTELDNWEKYHSYMFIDVVIKDSNILDLRVREI
jgi:hypothetical protein